MRGEGESSGLQHVDSGEWVVQERGAREEGEGQWVVGSEEKPHDIGQVGSG